MRCRPRVRGRRVTLSGSDEAYSEPPGNTSRARRCLGRHRASTVRPRADVGRRFNESGRATCGRRRIAAAGRWSLTGMPRASAALPDAGTGTGLARRRNRGRRRARGARGPLRGGVPASLYARALAAALARAARALPARRAASCAAGASSP